MAGRYTVAATAAAIQASRIGNLSAVTTNAIARQGHPALARLGRSGASLPPLAAADTHLQLARQPHRKTRAAARIPDPACRSGTGIATGAGAAIAAW